MKANERRKILEQITEIAQARDQADFVGDTETANALQQRLESMQDIINIPKPIKKCEQCGKPIQLTGTFRDKPLYQHKNKRVASKCTRIYLSQVSTEHTERLFTNIDPVSNSPLSREVKEMPKKGKNEKSESEKSDTTTKISDKELLGEEPLTQEMIDAEQIEITDETLEQEIETEEGSERDIAEAEANLKKAEPEPEAPFEPKAFNAEEGIYAEQLLYPTEITIGHNKEGQRTALLTDASGETALMEGNVVVRRLFQLFADQLRIPEAQIEGYKEPYHARALAERTDKQVTKILNKAFKNRMKDRPEKPPHIKLLMDGDMKIVGCASKTHKQISRKTVREIVESAITNAYGTCAPMKDGEIPTRWDYAMPFKNPNLSAWATVDAGSNLAMGKASINVHTRFRTERPDFGGAPACLNMMGLWGPVLEFFDLKKERIHNAEAIPVLSARNIHMKGTFADREQAITTFTELFKTLQANAEKLDQIIEDSITAPLSFDEMKALLWAYDEKLQLPKYIIADIMARARAQNEETVWAFAQAISYIRTHGTLKETKRSVARELRSIVTTLENIAGEVLSISPTIQTFHDKIGLITFEALIEKPKKDTASRTPAPVEPGQAPVPETA